MWAEKLFFLFKKKYQTWYYLPSLRKKMKLNIYFISTKTRLNIKTAFLRESVSPFGKDTIRQYRSQIYRLSLSPTSFTNIKFTCKPFPSAQNYGFKLNDNLFIHIFLRYITYNLPKLSISTHWTKYWPLMDNMPGKGHTGRNRSTGSYLLYLHRINLAWKGTQHVSWTPFFPACL